MKKQNSYIIFGLLIAMLVIREIYSIKIRNNIKEDYFKVSIKDNCQKEKEYYYTDEDGLSYYTSCIDKITDANDNDLKTLIENKELILNEILAKKIKSNIYRDGGSTFYEFKNFSILKCNKIISQSEGNYEAIIIGKKDLNINDGYCTGDFDINL